MVDCGGSGTFLSGAPCERSCGLAQNFGTKFGSTVGSTVGTHSRAVRLSRSADMLWFCAIASLSVPVTLIEEQG